LRNEFSLNPHPPECRPLPSACYLRASQKKPQRRRVVFYNKLLWFVSELAEKDISNVVAGLNITVGHRPLAEQNADMDVY
jgi:hypothetical protein